MKQWLLTPFIFLTSSCITGAKIESMYCSQENARSTAIKHAKTWKAPNSTLRLCKSSKLKEDYKQAYLSAYRAQLKSQCSSVGIANLAKDDAQIFLQRDLSVVDRECSQKNLSSKYQDHYKIAMKNACRSQNILVTGKTNGLNGNDRSQVVARYCPTSSVTLYTSSYSQGRTEAKLDDIQLQMEQEATRRRERLDKLQQSAEQRAGRSKYGYYCFIKDDRAFVKVTNRSNSHLRLRNRWLIEYFNDKGRRIGDDTTYESLSISQGDTEEFDDPFIPSGAKSCRASIKE